MPLQLFVCEFSCECFCVWYMVRLLLLFLLVSLFLALYPSILLTFFVVCFAPCSLFLFPCMCLFVFLSLSLWVCLCMWEVFCYFHHRVGLMWFSFVVYYALFFTIDVPFIIRFFSNWMNRMNFMLWFERAGMCVCTVGCSNWSNVKFCRKFLLCNHFPTNPETSQ